MKKLKIIFTVFLFMTLIIGGSCPPDINDPADNNKPAKIKLNSIPPEAKIWVNENDEGKTEATLSLIDGDSITVKFCGFKDAIFKVNVSEDGEFENKEDLDPYSDEDEDDGIIEKTVELIPYPGKIIINSIPDSADISFLYSDSLGNVDTVKKHTKTPSTFYLDIEELNILLELDGYNDTTFTVNIKNIGTVITRTIKLDSSLGIVDINSDPVGAEIWMGTDLLGVTPKTIYIEPGNTEIILKMAGYEDCIIPPFNVKYGKDNPPQFCTLIAQPFNLNITSIPDGAEIYLNDDDWPSGKTNGTVELDPFKIYNITLKLEEYYDITFPVNTVPGGKIDKIIDLTAIPSEITINSIPDGAKIKVDNISLLDITNTTLSLNPGERIITLTKGTYLDTTFTIFVEYDKNDIYTIELTPDVYKFMDTVKIFPSGERVGIILDSTGIDLSSGDVISLSSERSNSMDVFYFSSTDGSTYLVESPDEDTDIPRKTKFFIGSSDNIYDGIDSPLKDATWSDSIPDVVKNYIFLYDEDGHYSKFKITYHKPGSKDDPGYIKVIWMYNPVEDNRLFPK